MAVTRSKKEIGLLREANAIVADVLAELAERVAPGITTGELEAAAARLIRKSGAKPAFLGYHDYPACTCISVEEVVVHGIPGERVIREGEIVSIDVGVEWKGYFGDAALTVPCGEVDVLRKRLMATTDRALARGIAAACAGNHLSEVSRAVEDTCVDAGFQVVRVFVGHGIGTKMHEAPQIPNFVTSDRGPVLRSGMVLAIEPMVNAGTADVRILADGWTAVTQDGRPSAHFEHSVVVRERSAEILSLTPRMRWGQDLL